MPRPTFSLTDLVLSLALTLILALFCFAATVNLDTRNARVKCASNLREIGQGLLLYFNDSKGSYPRTRYDPATADQPTAFTGIDYSDPFAADCPQTNDVSGALFLLLRTEDIVSDVFVCPATGHHPDRFGGHTNLAKSNFPSAKSLDYSYANPYPNAAAKAAGFDLTQSMDPTFAIAADMNPGTPDLLKLTLHSSKDQLRAGNSLNHSGDGQNVLFIDGHVEFDNNPFVGVHRDNIYTWGPSGQDPNSSVPLTTGGSAIVGSPINPADSVLLPTVLMTPVAPAFSPSVPLNLNPPSVAVASPTSDSTEWAAWLAAGAALLLFLLLAALALAYKLRKHSRPQP